MQGGPYCGDNVIADLVDGVVVRSYVTPGLDQNISLTLHAPGPVPQAFYYNQDERQSVLNLTDSTGAVAASYGYSAYGDPIDQFRSQVSALSLQNRYTYTGRESSEDCLRGLAA